MESDVVVLLALEGLGDRLVVRASGHAPPGDVDLVDLVVDVEAHPFSGQVRQTVTSDDLRFFAQNLRRLTSPGTVILGGERMLELCLAVGAQSPGDGYVVEVSVTPSGDDPYPWLRFLLFDQGLFGAEAADAVEAFLVATP